MPDVRKAYVFSPRAPRADGLAGRTEAAGVEADALAIVAAWNRCVPANHVRVITSVRFSDLRAALAVFAVAEITGAIAFYGKQSWQRAKRAWATFDHFIQVQRLTGWIERAAEAAEAVAKRAAVAEKGPAAGLVAKVAATKDVSSDYQLRRRAWEALPPSKRNELLERARSEMHLRWGGGTEIRGGTATTIAAEAAIRARAYELMEQERSP